MNGKPVIVYEVEIKKMVRRLKLRSEKTENLSRLKTTKWGEANRKAPN